MFTNAETIVSLQLRSQIEATNNKVDVNAEDVGIKIDNISQKIDIQEHVLRALQLMDLNTTDNLENGMLRWFKHIYLSSVSLQNIWMKVLVHNVSEKLCVLHYVWHFLMS